MIIWGGEHFGPNELNSTENLALALSKNHPINREQGYNAPEIKGEYTLLVIGKISPY
jgi:hypothetical protein